MNVDTFLEQFGHLADAPDGIKKLRELILDLAVRGKLVEQDPDDEPASELLLRIEKEFQALENEKKIPKVDHQKIKREDKLLFEIPSGWIQCSLYQIIRISSGKNLPSKKMKKGKIPVYGGNGITGFHDECNVEPQTIVIGRVGFYCGSVHVTNSNAWVTDNAFIVTYSRANMNNQFLYWLLKTTDLQKNNSATAQPVISGKKIYPLNIPIPPLAEQKRIVAKVDELMALCDELETQQQQRQTVHAELTTASLHQLTTAETPRQLTKAWQRIDTQFDQLFTTRESIEKLRQTILQLAVQGKLVPQDESSPLVQLSELLDENSLNGYSKKPDINPIGTQILRISAATSRSDAIVDEADYRYVKLTETEKTKFGLQPGDLLACRFNGNLHYVARFAIYQGYSKGLQIYPDKLIRFRLNLKKAIPEYIRYAMNSRQSRDSIEKMCATTAGNIGISATKLKTIAIPVPAISVQKRIVSKVDQLMELCVDLEQKLEMEKDGCDSISDALTASVLLSDL